ncbi:BTB/POZ protein [Xylariaceae sp. FL1272]|nr:BTB/POZ protein [Xylariaceae sp. FL1272]
MAVSVPKYVVLDVAAPNYELFASGQLSDITVYFGSYEFKLHKAVLAPRSEWFKRVISEGSEASVDEVRIDDQDPQVVAWVLEWIYTGVMPRFLTWEERWGRYGPCISIFECAQYFEIPGLCNASIHWLESSLLECSRWVQCFTPHDAHYEHVFLPHDLESFMDAARTAYELDEFEDEPRFRLAFTKFLADCHYYVMYDAWFHWKAMGIPQFWKDVEDGYSEARRNFRVGVPDHCSRRKDELIECVEGIRWSSLLDAGYGVVEGICDKCQPRAFGQIIQMDLTNVYRGPTDEE